MLLAPLAASSRPSDASSASRARAAARVCMRRTPSTTPAHCLHPDTRECRANHLDRPEQGRRLGSYG